MKTVKFNSKTMLTRHKIYQNLYNFIKRSVAPPHQYIQIMTKVLVTEKSKSRILSLTKFSYLDLTNKFECKKFKIIEFQNSMISMTTTSQLVLVS